MNEDELGRAVMEDIQQFERKGLCSESPNKQSLTAELSASKPKKKKKKKNVEKIIINVGDTVYPVIRFVGKKMLKWKLQYDKEATNWDIYWTDCAVQAETLGKMQPYQKINHFPGMYALARKNHLGRNLMKMAKQFPDHYKFFPKTWLLPAEFSDFRNQFQKGKSRTFIVKPEASCQGRGIFLTRDIEDVSSNEHYVAQRYLTKPYLIDNLKFDLRIYVLIAGCEPLRLYIYKEGLGRFATEDYCAPNRDNMDNVCMHLTNYAINKDNENFVFNENENDMTKGHKRSLTSVFETLKENGADVDKLWKSIKKMMIKTFCAVQPILSHHYKSCQPDNFINNMCFEVLGMDVILNHKLKPFLLEVNHTPSFTTDTPLDSVIKRNLICDAIKLMNVSLKQKNEIIISRKEIMQMRVLTGKKTKLTAQNKTDLVTQLQKQRDEWEDAHLGGFEKMYPLDQLEEDYDSYLAHAKVLYEEQTGAHIRRNNKKGTSMVPQTQIPNNSNLTQNQVQLTKSQDLEKIYSAKQTQKPQLEKKHNISSEKKQIPKLPSTSYTQKNSSFHRRNENPDNNENKLSDIDTSTLNVEESFSPLNIKKESISRKESRGKNTFTIKGQASLVKPQISGRGTIPDLVAHQNSEENVPIAEKYTQYLKTQNFLKEKLLYKQNQYKKTLHLEYALQRFKNEIEQQQESESQQEITVQDQKFEAQKSVHSLGQKQIFSTSGQKNTRQNQETKPNQLYRVVQPPQNVINQPISQAQQQGNFLTPKLFQLSGINTKNYQQQYDSRHPIINEDWRVSNKKRYI